MATSDPLRLFSTGPAVAALQTQLKQAGFPIPGPEVGAQTFGAGTRSALQAFQKSRGLSVTGVLDDATAGALNQALGGATTEKADVSGRLFFQDGRVAPDARVRAMHRGIVRADVRLGEAVSDDHGFYSIAYDPQPGGTNLEMRAATRQGGEVTIGAIKTRADRHEVMNLVVPDAAGKPAREFRSLKTDLDKTVGTRAKLAAVREDDQAADLSAIHSTTGWDARLVALASASAKDSDAHAIDQEALYAMYRAGLPQDPQMLARLTPVAVEKALQKANGAGVVSLSSMKIAQAKKAHETFSLAQWHQAKIPGAVSTHGELVAASGLATDDQTKFAQACFEFTGKTDDGQSDQTIWEKAQAKGVSPSGINLLKIQGSLSILTYGNAKLAAAVQTHAAIDDPDNLYLLADAGYYEADAWKTRIDAAATSASVSAENLIPADFTADTADERKTAYAEDLARKIRIAYPTRVAAARIELTDADKRLHVGDDYVTQKVRIAGFLRAADRLGFELGGTSLKRFLDAHAGQTTTLFGQGATDADIAATKQAVWRLQRLYQITPSDASLVALSNSKFGSSADITAFSCDEFVKRFLTVSPGTSATEAKMIFRKAQQVHSIALGVLGAAQQLKNTPAIFGISGSMDRSSAISDLRAKFPTLETLFGALDFCACEHCRSVLSPAAYLVDLLEFLTPEDEVWNHWKEHHQDVTSPKKPYEVLQGRRPDLEYLPLTCANTNTAMPYIDLVNEILEYYVAHVGGLDGGAAHDTGSAETADLVAEPQFTIASVYDPSSPAANPANAVYPPGLPFDLATETVRRFCDQAQMPYWRVRDVFGSDSFANRAAVFTEYLGLSKTEVEVFTRPEVSPRPWYDLYGYETANAALADWAIGTGDSRLSAKKIARQLGISYSDLGNVVNTAFINPELSGMTVLRRLGIDPGDVVRFMNDPVSANYAKVLTSAQRSAFSARLGALTAAWHAVAPSFDAVTWLSSAWGNGDFEPVLLLDYPGEGFDFGQTALRRFTHLFVGSDATALDLLKINLFVRLWKKLGWTIEEADRALMTFLPKQTMQSLSAGNIGSAFQNALIQIAHLKALVERLPVGKNGRVKLLALWDDLATTGENPLYDQIFLSAARGDKDAVFDSPTGDFLTNANNHVDSYVGALQGFLGLTADEIASILGSGYSAPLSVANVSLLYRHALLSKALKVSVHDLLVLKDLSGIDPFGGMEDQPFSTLHAAQLIWALDDDSPYQTLRFLDVVDAAKGSGFKVEDLDYLLRHRFDPAGKYRQDVSAVLGLVKTLRAAMAGAVNDLRAAAAAPDLSDDTVRAKVALVAPSEAVNVFMGLLTNATTYEEVTDAQQALNPTPYASDWNIAGLPYDSGLHKQHLVYRGYLSAGDQTALMNAHVSDQGVLGPLLTSVHDQATAAIESYLGFIAPGDYAALFGPLPAADDLRQTELLERRRAALARIEPLLIRQAIADVLATDLDIEPTFAAALLAHVDVATSPATPNPTPLLDAFASATTAGLGRSDFASGDASGSPLATAVAVTQVTTDGKPTGAHSAKFEGYFEVPATGNYRFFASLSGDSPSDTPFEIWIGDGTAPVLTQTLSSAAPESSSVGLALRAGVPTRFVFLAKDLDAGIVTVSIQGESLPRGGLDRLTLYLQTAVSTIERARILARKVVGLAKGLDLNEREVGYFLAHPDDFDGFRIGWFPPYGDDPGTPPAATALFAQFLHLAEYARLKREVAGGQDDLIDVFDHARRALAPADVVGDVETAIDADLSKRLAALTNRDETAMTEVLDLLGYTAAPDSQSPPTVVSIPALVNEQGVAHLWDVLQMATRFGLPVSAVSAWGTAETPDLTLAGNVRDSFRARYSPDAWRLVARPIFDDLRRRKRDALCEFVAYRLFTAGKIAAPTVDALFEYFLIDPGMEPAVLTSRLRLAISSVQTFIQRCLMNLEQPDVLPSAINAKQWEWMKRYRVWEANRKIFLFPENWLEPEFRDDKSHLFQALESALLQDDIDNDLAEDAFFAYLKGLEQIARLDIATAHIEEKDDPALNVLHVIGRTFNLPHKYFYRRYVNRMWTPWEPIDAEIEGDHVAAVVWRDRLWLFWVAFLEKPKQQDTSKLNFPTSGDTVGGFSGGAAPLRQVEARLNWCDYARGAWTTPESSGHGDPIRVTVGTSLDLRDVGVHIVKEGDDERAVVINLGEPIAMAFRLAGRNSVPEVVPLRPRDESRYLHNQGTLAVQLDETTADGTRTTRHDILKASDYLVIGTGAQQAEAAVSPAGLPVGVPSNDRTIRRCGNQMLQPSPGMGRYLAPFFFQDRSNAFFVEPDATEAGPKDSNHWTATGVWRKPGDWDDDATWSMISLGSQAPSSPASPYNPTDTDPIHGVAQYQIQPKEDWLVDTTTVLAVAGTVVGKQGGTGTSTGTAGGSGGASGITPGGTSTGGGTTGGAGSTGTAGGGSTGSSGTGGITVVGTGGYNPKTTPKTKTTSLKI